MELQLTKEEATSMVFALLYRRDQLKADIKMYKDAGVGGETMAHFEDELVRVIDVLVKLGHA